MRAALLLFIGLLFCTPAALAQEADAPITLEGFKDLPVIVGEKPGWAEFSSPYAGDLGDLSRPNMTAEEVSAFAAAAVPDVLGYFPQKFKEQVRTMQAYFQPAGWKGYAEFLRANELDKAAASGRYAVTAILEAPPLIVGSGVADGAWQWTLSMSVVVSVIKPDPAKNYQELVSVWTRAVPLKISVGRVASGGKNGLAIREWALTGPLKTPSSE